MPTLEECIELLEAADLQEAQATNKQPEQFTVLQMDEDRFNLLCIAAIQSLAKFDDSQEPNDLDLTMTLITKMLRLLPSRDDSKRCLLLDELSYMHYRRFGLLGDVQDLVKAVAEAEQVVSLTPDDHLDKCRHLNS
ncbi:hypothetical protein FRC07_012909, partial [Ceratobasidium sp. 392]